MEKEQAIKLLRAIVEVGSDRSWPQRRSTPAPAGLGTVPVTEPVMRALIAIAEHVEDPFRLICIQTLAEIRACLS